jgi:hypothetical protein
MSSGISRDEWLTALGNASTPIDDDPSVLTAGEAAELLGVCTRSAWVRLRRLVQSGGAVAVRVRRMTASGHVQTYPAYRLIKPLAKAKKR